MKIYVVYCWWYYEGGNVMTKGYRDEAEAVAAAEQVNVGGAAPDGYVGYDEARVVEVEVPA